MGCMCERTGRSGFAGQGCKGRKASWERSAGEEMRAVVVTPRPRPREARVTPSRALLQRWRQLGHRADGALPDAMAQDYQQCGDGCGSLEVTPGAGRTGREWRAQPPGHGEQHPHLCHVTTVTYILSDSRGSGDH